MEKHQSEAASDYDARSAATTGSPQVVELNGAEGKGADWHVPMDLNAMARIGQRVFGGMGEGDDIAGEISSSAIQSRRIYDIGSVGKAR